VIYIACTVVPEAMSSNSAAPMELPELIKLSWVQDLCSPSAPGRRFSRNGFLVMIAPDQFNSAQSELTDGATDVVFTATRVQTFSGDHYILASFERIG
jgi:hypothetical protein